MGKPNVIFFFSDQQRYDTICEEVTPNLCELAQDGTSFDFAYTCQPVCGPARASLQTGVYASINLLRRYFDKNAKNTKKVGIDYRELW